MALKLLPACPRVSRYVKTDRAGFNVRGLARYNKRRLESSPPVFGSALSNVPQGRDSRFPPATLQAFESFRADRMRSGRPRDRDAKDVTFREIYEGKRAWYQRARLAAEETMIPPGSSIGHFILYCSEYDTVCRPQLPS